MASINMSVRVDSELKAQSEEFLAKLGMTMNGAINMFLNQIVRDRAVPLSLSLDREEDIAQILTRRRAARLAGAEYLSNEEVLDSLRRILKEGERESA